MYVSIVLPQACDMDAGTVWAASSGAGPQRRSRMYVVLGEVELILELEQVEQLSKVLEIEARKFRAELALAEMREGG
jgi:hypothetical protein